MQCGRAASQHAQKNDVLLPSQAVR